MSFDKKKNQNNEPGNDLEKRILTDEEVERLIEISRSTVNSPICMALVGHDGVGKSGILLDSRSEEEVEQGKQIFIIDLDDSCGPLKSVYYRDDDSIVILNCLVINDNGEIDYVNSYVKLLSVVRYIIRNEKTLNLATVGLDGLDTMLKWCEYVMRNEDLKIDPSAQVKDQWQWSNRNRYFNTVLLLLKSLKCRFICTTHLKAEMKFVPKAGGGRELLTTGYHPDWVSTAPGMMFQKVSLERSQHPETGDVEITATVDKSKGALHLEGKKYLIAKVSGDKAEWIGLKSLISDIENLSG